jgi:alanine dehydrogenase
MIARAVGFAAMSLPVIGQEAVFSAVSPAEAITCVRDAFVHHHRGEWQMPPKVYLECPPGGDFRAMPAQGAGFALLKWICSFPGNTSLGLPAVSGVIALSDASTGELRALIDARAVTALRTGAVAAIATRALAGPGSEAVGVIGCGLHGGWVARCMAAAGYGPGVCADPRQEVAAAVAGELGWQAGSVAQTLAADIVCCVTPGARTILDVGDLRPGMHLNMLGADGSGKAEATIAAVGACALFCDEWEQAAHGGELAGAVAAGLVGRSDVTALGAVLTGEAPGRAGPDAVTLFDSTGLAIQDLAVSVAVYAAWRDGRIEAQTVDL